MNQLLGKLGLEQEGGIVGEVLNIGKDQEPCRFNQCGILFIHEIVLNDKIKFDCLPRKPDCLGRNSDSRGLQSPPHEGV
jgi:hypothetical protein